MLQQRAEILKMKTLKTDELLNQPKEKLIIMRKISYTIYLSSSSSDFFALTSRVASLLCLAS
jgi:hypothetical protein